ncbi:MAG: DsrE family protein [Nitrospirae bacterium]|jgi:sulfur relay (sulfurtransferase) complex TusBCD TusD component (DsrE family)|nr:DsrE family protein [Nitrospirota bacterium]
MSKTITLFLSASPYESEHTYTAIKLSEAALEKNYRVNLIASGDGVYNFLKGQKAKGIPNAEERFSELIKKGLRVDL